MWIERLFAEVQEKRPVSSWDIHQQDCPLCAAADAELGESGTNHPYGSDPDFIHFR